VAYALHAIEKYRGRVGQLLVVSPISAFEAWEEEAVECFDVPLSTHRVIDEMPPAGTNVVLINYQRLVSRLDDLSSWVQRIPTHVILDESHRMKRGASGQWGTACLGLAGGSTRRDILTGTPAPNAVSDLAPQLEFLWWPRKSDQVLPRAALSAQPSSDVISQVASRIRPLFVRTNKDELELPDVDMKRIAVEMKPVQRRIYQALRSRLALSRVSDAYERSRLSEISQVLIYLLAAATDPGLLAQPLRGTNAAPLALAAGLSDTDADQEIGDLIADYRNLEVPAKYDELVRRVEQNAAAGRKTLVWSNFVGALQDITHRLLAPYEPALIYGQVPIYAADADITTRRQELNRFRNDPDCQVLVANPAAMSEGVSLHRDCHDAIYVDRTFNAGQYLQSLDRIHRLGLAPDQETRVRCFVSRDSVDEIVDGRIAIKAKRLALMLADPGLVDVALPDEEEEAEPLDSEDAIELLGHLRADLATSYHD
jgi:SNF2 family DNA or RNA helicase